MKNIIIFDLDGTLADLSHRMGYINPPVINDPDATPPKTNWAAFYAACPHDTLIHHIAVLWHALAGHGDHELWIVTGRSREVERETLAWLALHDIEPTEIIMRCMDDYQPSHQLKKMWLDDGTIPPDRVLMALDDSSTDATMWRSAGIPCLQVAFDRA